jgi:hypothetical protein
MERNKVSVGQGVPIGDDGMWLSCNMNETVEDVGSDRSLSAAFIHRWYLLVNHLHVFCQKGDIQE